MQTPLVTWPGGVDACDIEDFNVGLVPIADGSTITVRERKLIPADFAETLLRLRRGDAPLRRPVIDNSAYNLIFQIGYPAGRYRNDLQQWKKSEQAGGLGYNGV